MKALITEKQREALELGRQVGIKRHRPKGLKYKIVMINKGWGLQAGWNKGKIQLEFTGKSYDGLHTWVERNLGRPKNCSQCGSNKNIEWSNISGKYKLKLFDWQRLCKKCHWKLDQPWVNRSRDYLGRFI